MNEDSSTATTDSTKDGAATEEYQHPNDLATELSAEDEAALVNETLGITGGKDDAPASTELADEGNTPPTATPPSGEDPADKPAATPPPADAPTGDEPPATPPSAEPPKKTDDAPESTTKLEPPTIKTDDLWVEVERVTKDDDGKESVEKVKLVYDPANPENFLPDDFTFKNDKQLAEVIEAKMEMARLYKERETEVESTKAVQTVEQEKQAQLDSWDAEIQDLIDAGVIEEPKAKPGEKGFAEDPSVKLVDSVFKYMVDQNAQRSKDGKEPLRSFGTAFVQYQNDAKVKSEAEAKKAENEETKRKGALVGGSSGTGKITETGYKSGSHASIWDVPVE